MSPNAQQAAAWNGRSRHPPGPLKTVVQEAPPQKKLFAVSRFRSERAKLAASYPAPGREPTAGMGSELESKHYAYRLVDVTPNAPPARKPLEMRFRNMLPAALYLVGAHNGGRHAHGYARRIAQVGPCRPAHDVARRPRWPCRRGPGGSQTFILNNAIR